MKKIIAVCVCAASVMAFGAANDVVLTFSSEGPDKYADGTTVLDGECYALAWIPAGSAGLSLAADGAVADPARGEVILTAAVAKGGRCPTIAFQLGADFAESHADGSWALYLLDTRTVAADGSVSLAGVANGRAKAVNAAGLVASASVRASVSDAAPASVASASGATAATASAVPAGAPTPTVKGIKVEGGLVYVTVGNTASYLQYNLAAGETPSDVRQGKAARNPVNGSVDEDIILVAPARENGGFFRVERN